MKVTTNYGLDGKVTVNFGTKDLPIDRRAPLDRTYLVRRTAAVS